MSSCLTSPATREGGSSTPVPGPAALLQPVWVAAGTTDLTDLASWAPILRGAHEVTVHLASTGALPWHLTVGQADPAVLAARTIAGAWRHVTRRPSDATTARPAGGSPWLGGVA